MMQQAQDFLDESTALHGLIAPLSDAALREPTAFKGWTIEDVITHLHVWNKAADLALQDGEAFRRWFGGAASAMQSGSMREFETAEMQGVAGQALVAEWADFATEMSQRFGEADPSARVAWAGPSMSVRSSISARLMETWAHGQEVYDLLGVERENGDRIRNIVVLGNNTFGWTYKVNGLPVPATVPHLVLTAPSGEVWTFNAESDDERIEGLAEEFCQVVTQTRNIADTNLSVTGPIATQWMAIAQCFAGGRETPPAPGTRVRRETAS